MKPPLRNRPRLRLALLVGANLVALVALARLLVGGDATAAATTDAARPAGAPDALASAPPPRAAPRRDRALEKRIATAIAIATRTAERATRGKVRGAEVAVSVHVRDADGGAELVAIQPDLSLRPASNLKLVTVATALVLLGPEWSFETKFEARGTVRDGVLEGDLVARAAGDPLYDPAGDGGLERWLGSLARQLSAAGIRRVRGALVLDEGSFLDPGPGPQWPAPSEHWKEYAALCGGFSANAGCITATVSAGAAGEAARVRVRPRAHGLRRRGEVVTGAAGTVLNVAVEARPHGLTVRGSVPTGTEGYVARFAHPDPVELCGHALSAGLARHGVPIEGGFRRERGAPEGTLVATLRSPLAEAVEPILRDSNNSVADQVFLATGHALLGRGDREGGRAATARALAELGVSGEGLAQVDGSGLSRADRVTARQMTALVDAVLDRDAICARLFVDALPVAGESGTLENRMRAAPVRGRVRAKTGFIGGTSGLSGLVETLDGRTLVFSILVSYPRAGGLNTSAWKPMQDAICELLVASEKSGS